jgi:MFS family permease
MGISKLGAGRSTLALCHGDSWRRKTGYFVLEGVNSFGTVFYFYYVYFYMQQTFGFGNKSNLLLAALNGATYAVGVWWAGKLAQRLGYFTSLKFGYFIMMAAQAIGSQLHNAPAQVLAMAATDLGMCFTWPVLEALVSEGEPVEQVPHMVGLYNVIWAGTGAVAYFMGGAVLEKFGLRSLFFIPMALNAGQLALTFRLQSRGMGTGPRQPTEGLPAPDGTPQRPSPARSLAFLRMAWLANPFAYIGINTLIAVVPGVARNFQLSTMLAGFCCSVWCFARMGAFVTLWLWNGWHYKFRWLLAAFVALAGSFAAILTVPSLGVLVLAQLIFGFAVGLIYYSSLYYSMDASELKSEHGGFHEAAIGLGNFTGPAVGAISLEILPNHANSGAVAVSILLLLGAGGLVTIWKLTAAQAGGRGAEHWH